MSDGCSVRSWEPCDVRAECRPTGTPCNGTLPANLASPQPVSICHCILKSRIDFFCARLRIPAPRCLNRRPCRIPAVTPSAAAHRGTRPGKATRPHPRAFFHGRGLMHLITPHGSRNAARVAAAPGRQHCGTRRSKQDSTQMQKRCTRNTRMRLSPAWTFTADIAQPRRGSRAGAVSHVPSACIRVHLPASALDPCLLCRVSHVLPTERTGASRAMPTPSTSTAAL